eukprot:g24161.t1
MSRALRSSRLSVAAAVLTALWAVQAFVAPPTRVSVEDARSVSLLRGQAKTVEPAVASDSIGATVVGVWAVAGMTAMARTRLRAEAKEAEAKEEQKKPFNEPDTYGNISMDDVKKYGAAGTLSYVITELLFWAIAFPTECIVRARLSSAWSSRPPTLQGSCCHSDLVRLWPWHLGWTRTSCRNSLSRRRPRRVLELFEVLELLSFYTPRGLLRQGLQWFEASFPSPAEELAKEALDLSFERFAARNENPQGLGFERLKVLLVSGASLTTEDLAKVLTAAPSLWKLDASHCGDDLSSPEDLSHCGRRSSPRVHGTASAILFREKPPEHRLLAQELLREARAARERKNPSAEPIRGRVFGDKRLSVRRWIRRRKKRQTVREAATIIARHVRGYLTRCKLLRKFLKLDTYKRIYFPASCKWEAIVLLNVARAACDMPPLPREHQFETPGPFVVRETKAPDFRELYRFGKLLGEGDFGIVYTCDVKMSGSAWDEDG